MNNKEKVIMFAIYDEGNIDLSYEKEKMLRDYCEYKNYEVVEVFRKGASYINQSFTEVIYIFLQMVYRYKSFNMESFETNYTKLVCYDLKELCFDDEQIITLATIAKDNGVAFETIMQGNIGNNLVYTTSITENVKNEIIQNEKYFVDLPF